jgi:Domain of unknown function (DUF5067)
MKKHLFTLMLGLILILAACGNSGESEEATASNGDKAVNETTESDSSNEEVETEAENTDVYFKDNEAKIDDLKIKITETKVIPVGEPGNEYGEKPVFAIWYETTNFTDKEIDSTTAWMAVFTAIQDNDPNAVNELEVGSLPDEAHLDSQLENIKKDGTVENSVAYMLDDSETPVTLVANQGLMGDEIGRKDYEIK